VEGVVEGVVEGLVEDVVEGVVERRGWVEGERAEGERKT
jgi:hypothetical protein